MENNSIDKTFSEASKKLEEPTTFPGFDKVWAKVEEKLDKKETKKRKTIGLWIPYGIAASLLIGSGIFYFTSNKENAELPPQSIANHTVTSENKSAEIPETIRKTDSLVKANIQSEMLPPPTAKIAYQKVSEISVNRSADRLPEVSAPQVLPQETAVAAEDKMMMETAERQNTEEVIAMGVRKEKASMVKALSSASPAKKRLAELNAVADTAEAVYPTSPYNRNELSQEPEILAYNKGYLQKDKLIAMGGNPSGFGKRIGNKEALNGLQGAVPGVKINSITGAPGSGKVDISISCQRSLLSDNNPLFIIDGAEASQETFMKTDPKKIESMQVFKGEKAIALFGTQAANGVILVETKDISKKEKRRMKKLFREKLPQK
ncbi:TonB-dependent SusC/RagA subfamily outer membrane receptor [Chryseobacterium sp. SORGH_AS 447]|uniref:TonB-dependent receptor plug domain-containing protein n=1 Tax=Chryseobacterium sp. SORGH_AS_0447 TaxID=3041769 RepID=UPI00278B69F4|nr:TonB-dependent receptor plug domain-containing protein [Chryseobacterium sp. SORGH_AS_0447]MDQ1161555.1 TonB-dependent SusC/RagA subfamily outer membrane receptor [Chryseobacterium sp. SORGH_AS_0447]